MNNYVYYYVLTEQQHQMLLNYFGGSEYTDPFTEYNGMYYVEKNSFNEADFWMIMEENEDFAFDTTFWTLSTVPSSLWP